jgi:hypothetical protein
LEVKKLLNWHLRNFNLISINTSIKVVGNRHYSHYYIDLCYQVMIAVMLSLLIYDEVNYIAKRKSNDKYLETCLKKYDINIQICLKQDIIKRVGMYHFPTFLWPIHDEW